MLVSLPFMIEMGYDKKSEKGPLLQNFFEIFSGGPEYLLI